MKKMMATLLLGTMGLMLVACSPKKPEPEVIEIPDPEEEIMETDDPEEEIYEGMNMANPWVDSDEEGVLEATGFHLVPPQGSVNVIYSYMSDEGMAQMNYNLEGAMWVYRVKPADALEDISGVYCEWDYVGETKVAGLDAMEYSYADGQAGEYIDNTDCVRVINWYDPENKATHSLSILAPDLNGMDTAVYAENLYRLLIAPESDGVGPIDEETAKGLWETDLYNSFLGLHVSDYDGSDIMVEEGGENGRLKVNVSLFRLCTLDDGEGIYENGMISFDSKDPNGNLIRCSLYYNSENSLCLEVEESTWDYLPNGTVFTGFDS